MGREYEWSATVYTPNGAKHGSGTASGGDKYTPEQAERDVKRHIKQPDQGGCFAEADVTVTESS